MIRKFFAVSLVALAAVPATSLAGTSSPDAHATASKQCTAVQAKIGAPSFNRAFASFGACVSALTPLARQSANAAEALCRVVGQNDENAYGKCVSTKERLASAATVSAAAACRAKLNFAACVALKTHSSLTLTPAQPSQAPQQQSSSGSTPAGGCGLETAGPAHPLVAGCAVAKPS
jgi:hypothetical protein